ncbi:hypothetical protein F4820DRAFT_58947 [Hypoxylon rubiginosum]|uniref:Uncharacterized protein n=1 Tax=Hypoxylon rubiginosum TaxID=110542 RepID=A0ACB9YQ79_9PEZI|nr:hypothetical protein F4820DRAFT_58947 [Hypoxylon rubiginosum]
MLLDPYVAPEDEPAGKRIKLDDGTFAETGTASQNSVQPDNVSFMPKPTAKRTIDETDRSASFDCARHFQDVNQFLELKTRRDYYEEYKEFPIPLKISFSNAKNNLRRLLTYGGPNRNETKRVWTVEDLDDAAVLERAMELMLRVRLGSNVIEMLPYPQIDFSFVSEEKRLKLEQALGETEIVDQDIDAVRDEANKSKSKFRPDEHDLVGVNKRMSLSDRDKVLNDAIARGPTNALKKMEREAREKQKKSRGDSTSELGSEHSTTTREDEEREEVEGVDADHDEDGGSDDNESLHDDAGLNDDANLNDEVGLNDNADLNDDASSNGNASSGDDDASSDEEESSPIDAGSANTASNNQDTSELEGINDHGDDHDEEEEDMEITSSRSTGRANAEPRGIKVKIEEIEAATLQAVRTTNTTVEKPDHRPRAGAGAGAVNLPRDGERGDLLAARVKEESSESSTAAGMHVTSMHEPILIDDSD